MRRVSFQKNSLLIPVLFTPFLAFLISTIFLLDTLKVNFSDKKAQKTESKKPIYSIFSQVFPNNPILRNELNLMRYKGTLKASDEIAINKSIHSASLYLGMPPAILWCLLFQESRLNHLLGLGESRFSKGIGQFSHFGFMEINRDLNRYYSNNLEMFKKVIGKDVRPIAPLKDIRNPSSYFYIPTAVSSSAAYLNNRYHHLKKSLEARKMDFDPELLWLYSAMAYNKGTRSVLSYWNQTLSRKGNQHLSNALKEKEVFLADVSNAKWVTKILNQIWPKPKAEKYSKELIIHMRKMKECSISISSQTGNKKTDSDNP